jgi:hypothetical protein
MIFRRRFSPPSRRNFSIRSTRSRAADAFVPLSLSNTARTGRIMGAAKAKDFG